MERRTVLKAGLGLASLPVTLAVLQGSDSGRGNPTLGTFHRTCRIQDGQAQSSG